MFELFDILRRRQAQASLSSLVGLRPNFLLSLFSPVPNSRSRPFQTAKKRDPPSSKSNANLRRKSIGLAYCFGTKPYTAENKTMRQRTTFVHRPGEAVDPALLSVSATGSLAGPSINAAREDRLTVPLGDLPDELQALFRDTHQLYIRWVSPHPHEALSPLLSRLPPGFHVFYSPRSETER